MRPGSYAGYRDGAARSYTPWAERLMRIDAGLPETGSATISPTYRICSVRRSPTAQKQFRRQGTPPPVFQARY